MNVATNINDEIIEKRFEAAGAGGLSVADAARLLAPKYGDGTPNQEAMPIVLDWMQAVATRVQEPHHREAEAKRRAEYGKGVSFTFPADEIEGLDDEGLREKYDQAMTEYQRGFVPSPFRLDLSASCITRQAIVFHNKYERFPFDLPSGWLVESELDIWKAVLKQNAESNAPWFKIAASEVVCSTSTNTIHAEYCRRLAAAGFRETPLSTFKKWLTEQTPSKADYPAAILESLGTNADRHGINWKG